MDDKNHPTALLEKLLEVLKNQTELNEDYLSTLDEEVEKSLAMSPLRTPKTDWDVGTLDKGMVSDVLDILDNPNFDRTPRFAHFTPMDLHKGIQVENPIPADLIYVGPKLEIDIATAKDESSSRDDTG